MKNWRACQRELKCSCQGNGSWAGIGDYAIQEVVESFRYWNICAPCMLCLLTEEHKHQWNNIPCVWLKLVSSLSYKIKTEHGMALQNHEIKRSLKQCPQPVRPWELSFGCWRMRIQFAMSGNDQCCMLHQALQYLYHALHDNQPEKEKVIMQLNNAWPDTDCLCVCVCVCARARACVQAGRPNFNVCRIQAKLMHIIWTL